MGKLGGKGLQGRERSAWQRGGNWRLAQQPAGGAAAAASPRPEPHNAAFATLTSLSALDSPQRPSCALSGVPRPPGGTSSPHLAKERKDACFGELLLCCVLHSQELFVWYFPAEEASACLNGYITGLSAELASRQAPHTHPLQGSLGCELIKQ